MRTRNGLGFTCFAMALVVLGSQARAQAAEGTLATNSLACINQSPALQQTEVTTNGKGERHEPIRCFKSVLRCEGKHPNANAEPTVGNYGLDRDACLHGF